jgi:hypothetical protein
MARTEDAHLGATIPEADRLEREQQADQAAEHEREWPIHSAIDADEADLLEQAQEVIGDPDEEYSPHSS